MMRKLLSTVILEEGAIAMPLAVGMAKVASHPWEAKKYLALVLSRVGKSADFERVVTQLCRTDNGPRRSGLITI